MNTIKDIDTRISELQRAYDDVEGTPTEIYTRIVGYYRSLKNWNRGKREEYDHRKTFTGQARSNEGAPQPNAPAVTPPTAPAVNRIPDVSRSPLENQDARYIYFYRATCPNCPPVQSELESTGLTGEKIDVDTEHGIEQAMAYQVLSTPTVIFLNSDGSVRAKISSVERLRSALLTVS